MTNSNRSLRVFLAFLLVLTFNSGGCPKMVNAEQRTWCVAKPSANNTALQENIDFACKNVNCNSILKPGCPCSKPATMINRASVAMNLYYQSTAKNSWNCDFTNSALIVITDPSKYSYPL
ncbi:hypothetical protein ACHQM5_004416 [Ranunculus cassubicifolius]